MKENVNKVIAGDYKNNQIQFKNENTNKVVLVIKNFLSKAEMPMDKTTIKRITNSQHSLNKHEIIIEWNDGKISQAIVDDTLYSELYLKIKGERY